MANSMSKKRAVPKRGSSQRALVVGVSDYPDPNNKLPAVAADVREMAKVLSSKHGTFPAKGVTVVADKQATRDKVLSALRAVFGGAAADETVFVYLAGHGVVIGGRYYYVAYDTKGEDSAVPLDEIKSLFDGTKSRRVFLWLDFCHSGGILARGRGADDMAAIRRSIGVVSGHGKIIVAACARAQYAHEDPALGHGLFTHALLRGLRGEAKSAHGDVTAPSLYEFIVRQVKHPAQQPVFFGEMSGLIVLAHYPERASAPAKPPAKAKPAQAKATKAKAAPKAGGTWVMLGDHFFRADAVRHCADGTVEVTTTTSGGEDAAFLAALRTPRLGGGSDLPFAANNDSHVVRVRSVESEAAGGRQVWALALSIEDDRLGGGGMDVTYNMGGKTYMPDDIARMRAGRILLNDPPPRAGPGRGYSAEDSLLGIIEGSGRYPARECVLRSVFASHGKDPNWKEFARLKSIFLLKATGTFEHVLELKIGAVRSGKVGVKFRGRRPEQYGRGGGSTVEVTGACVLTNAPMRR